MRLTLLAALISAVLASHASAQISAGPVGPFAVVDDNGKTVGRSFLAGDWKEFWVSISTPLGSGFVTIESLTNRDYSDSKIQTTYLSFTTNDCSGQAYRTDNFPPSLNGGPLYIVGPDAILYAADGPRVTVSSATRLGDGGGCSSDIQPVTAYPVTQVADLAAEFTPPFHIVTVASQTAAVPIHIGWLLAGVMLGLGVKAIRNSSRSTL